MNIVARPNSGNNIKVTSAGIRHSNIHVAPSSGEYKANVYDYGQPAKRGAVSAASQSQTQSHAQTSFTDASEHSMIHSDGDDELQELENEDDDMLRELELLSNPSKLNSSTGIGDEQSESIMQSSVYDEEGNIGAVDIDSSLQDQGAVREEKQDEQAPRSDRGTAREKYKYLNKLRRLAKKGIHVKPMNTANTLDELKEEYERAFHMSNADGSIKVGRRVLMAFVTGIEFANERFKPFKISLNGWSEHVYENIEEYDDALEQLTDSYTSSMEVSPEWTIILGLIGSAFMFHLSNTMFKSMMPSAASASPPNQPTKSQAGLDAEALQQALKANRHGPAKAPLSVSESTGLFNLPTNDTFPELPKSARGVSSRIDELDDDTRSQVSDALDSVRTDSSRKKKKGNAKGNTISVSLN